MDPIQFYDILFLILFTLVAIIFLYRKRKNLKRQGLLYLYPTKIGINIIDRTAKKYSKILKPLQYVVVACGYALMLIMLYAIIKFSYSYITSPTIAQQIKIPVVMPLVPYIDKLFNLSFLPSLYFTYWIIIIAVIAIPHEFSHGIFARLNKIKVHSTGFGFLGPFLAAFVEPDEKELSKSKKFPQLSILAGGTFANIVMSILFAILIWIFFVLAFVNSGVVFSMYSSSLVNLSDISSVNGIQIQNTGQIQSLLSEDFTEITALNKTYFVSLSSYKSSIDNNLSVLIALDDAPAFHAGLSGAIFEFDGKKISSYGDLASAIDSRSPGDLVQIKTLNDGKMQAFEIKLGERNNKAYLGIIHISSSQIERKGLLSSISISFYKIIDPIKYNQYLNGIEFTSRIGPLGIFIYNLLWWLVLINISVALCNMLPLGIFDGGRFFMLTIWGITGSKKIGEYAYKASTYILLLLIAALMVKWAFIFF